jgi:hypothetical protein
MVARNDLLQIVGRWKKRLSFPEHHFEEEHRLIGERNGFEQVCEIE